MCILTKHADVRNKLTNGGEELRAMRFKRFVGVGEASGGGGGVSGELWSMKL